jgi:transcription elongation GreA/GreB family factor
MTISTVDIRQRLQDAIAAAGANRAAELALLEQLIVGVQGPQAALVHDAAAGFGSEVTVEDLDTGERAVHRLMSGEAMDLDAGHVSTDSPLGTALLGRSVGDVVEVETPRGRRRLRVVGVQTLSAFLDALDGASPDESARRSQGKWRSPRSRRAATYG